MLAAQSEVSLYVDIILFTSNLKFLSSLYLTSTSQLMFPYFMAGLPILGSTTLYGFFAVAAAIACIAPFTTVLAIASFAIAYSLAHSLL